MPPDDPLGRDGPTLDEFLRKSKEYQTDDRYVQERVEGTLWASIQDVGTYHICAKTSQ